jgi:hypothetical protein
MTQQEALSALFNNAARRPVDVNLGQVPLTPTIGRMGNYNVVVRDTPRDNSALELSRALSQLPQLLGQARNISAASGARQAEEITLEELETKVKNGDADAKGTMTWLGADKAYQELAYKRLADANITPTLTNISSEIDRMSHAELLKFNSPDDIKDHVQGRLVGSLDPGIMETIKGKPWMEIRHNRYMEAIVPEYVEKVNASIEGRKHEFKIKEAIAALETNFLAQAGINLEDIPTEQIDSVLAVSQEAKFDPSQMWLDNFQYALDFARSQGEASGLDRFQIEDTLIPALTAKYNMLVEDEHHSEADLLLEAMESGSLKINGRPINKSSAGMRLIQNAEARLERSLEADEGEFDQKKVDSYMLKEITRYNDARALSDFQTEDYEEYYRQQRADLDNPELGLSVREQLELSLFYDKEIARLRGSERIYENFSNPAKDKKKEEFKQTYETISAVSLRPTISVESAREASGLDPSVFDSNFLQPIIDKSTGLPTDILEFREDVKPLLNNAALQAESSTVETYIDRPRGDLFLGSDSVNAGNNPDQMDFRGEVSETAQGFLNESLGKYLRDEVERRQAQNPPVSDEEKRKQKAEDELEALEEAQYYESARDGSIIIDDEGKLTPDVSTGSINRGSVYASGAGFDTRPRASVTKYDINKVNRTLANEYGREAVKGNPVNQRIKLINSLVREASNKGRRNFIGKRMASVYKTDAFDQEVTNELEVVRNSGLPLDVLIKDGGNVSGTYRTGGFLGLFTDENKYVIPYNYFDTFNKPEETKKRIFNMGAVTKYIKTGDSSDLEKIRAIYLPSMPLEDLIKNQVTFFESLFGDITK